MNETVGYYFAENLATKADTVRPVEPEFVGKMLFPKGHQSTERLYQVRANRVAVIVAINIDAAKNGVRAVGGKNIQYGVVFAELLPR